jgi:hypothetical protein
MTTVAATWVVSDQTKVGEPLLNHSARIGLIGQLTNGVALLGRPGLSAIRSPSAR